MKRAIAIEPQRDLRKEESDADTEFGPCAVAEAEIFALFEISDPDDAVWVDDYGTLEGATRAAIKLAEGGLVEWPGSEFPKALAHLRIIPVFRADPDAETAEREASGRGLGAHNYCWTQSGNGSDIVAFMVVQP